jgi:hypothetical protein
MNFFINAIPSAAAAKPPTLFVATYETALAVFPSDNHVTTSTKKVLNLGKLFFVGKLFFNKARKEREKGARNRAHNNNTMVCFGVDRSSQKRKLTFHKN